MTEQTQHNELVAPRDIMHYESDIWAVADLLLSVSVKQSDFPVYMMPFFALAMLEGRMLNAMAQIREEEGTSPEEDPDDFKEAFLEKECGYNEFIVMQGKTLASICRNDKTFDQDFSTYLKAFDPVLKKLLGIERDKTDKKYLNMDGIVAELRGKKILMQVVAMWARIDLSPYDNSAITTLEEHIKRKWADISAPTAGEQYTPDDIIALIAEIIASKIQKPKDEIVHVYDPTCGGANLLFGVADRLHNEAGYHNIATYGSEYNDALYALAAIESRFRPLSTIEYGNTLTRVPFQEKQFDVIVANPPYGTKWSGYEKEIKMDERGQFPGGLPSVSDGQLLFMQHILWQLADSGIAVEVHNGSTLFSGNAGSGECNIRKYIFDHDWVEAIIQMPQNEFFNTGIYTYLWVMNKQKPLERRDRVVLIDGSNLWQLLKKAKGDKRREMLSQHRQQIVDALLHFTESDICKVFPREYFYYNKQQLTLTEVSASGHHVGENICASGKPFDLKKPVSITLGDTCYKDLTQLSADDIKAMAKRVTTEKTELAISIETENDGTYAFCPEESTILHTTKDGTVEDLGCGLFAFKASISKTKGTVCKISIAPLLTDDYEIIPHHLDRFENDREIQAFIDKYITKPYTLGGNTVGVEVNFNKEFFVAEELESTELLLQEIQDLNSQIKPIAL